MNKTNILASVAFALGTLCLTSCSYNEEQQAFNAPPAAKLNISKAVLMEEINLRHAGNYRQCEEPWICMKPEALKKKKEAVKPRLVNFDRNMAMEALSQRYASCMEECDQPLCLPKDVWPK